MTVLGAAERLRDAVARLPRPRNVAYVYDPLDYAWEPHERFVHAYGGWAPRRGLFLGMNPGAWGAMQTGVPFADAETARDWMGITGRVGQPPRVHPRRPVLGFDATRRDGSGTKFYGWARESYGTARAFFDDFYVINYCPLVFFDAQGRNVTPDRLARDDRERLWPACGTHLVEVVDALRPDWLLPLGAFADARARAAAQRLDVPIRRLLHPSPAHPANNFGWGADLSFL